MIVEAEELCFICKVYWSPGANFETTVLSFATTILSFTKGIEIGDDILIYFQRTLEVLILFIEKG